MRHTARVTTFVALVGAFLAAPERASAQGVGYVMTGKTLPQATIEVIDPESGTSTGSGGSSEVRLSVGDVILFKFKYAPVPDGQIHGIGGWLTEYIPPNTQVIGVRLTDANGLTLEPRYPGTAASSQMAELHADTGVFYATAASTSKNPNNAFITLTNGLQLLPDPREHITVARILGIGTSGTSYFTHNTWDEAMEEAFGGNTIPAAGRGSPVAGPLTWYQLDNTAAVGPWQRIKYPGSLIGTGSSGPTPERSVLGTTAGFDVTPLNPLPTTSKAVRYAVGAGRAGDEGFAEVALRVLGVPIDNLQNRDVDCSEMFGADILPASHDPWDWHIPSPACAFLILLFDFQADKRLGGVGTLISYTINGSNLSTQTDTNAVVRLKFNENEFDLANADGATYSADCDGGGPENFACITWPTMTLDPGEDYVFHPQLTVAGASGGGAPNNTVYATYTSTRIPAPVGQTAGFTAQQVVITKPISVLSVDTVTLSATSVAAGGNITVNGIVQSTGTASPSLDSFTPVVPTGWTVSNVSPPASLTTGAPHPFSFRVNVPAATPTGLYPVHLQLKASQSGFGAGQPEWFFSKIVMIPVGAVRSTTPAISCPGGRIQSGATAITGTDTEANGTIIRLYFNLLERGNEAMVTTPTWSVPQSDWLATFGALYGGVEIRATAQAPGELESELSAPCTVTHVPACSDGVNNDGDGFIDFPYDQGCDNPGDNDELNVIAQCMDTIDNDGDLTTDYPADISCQLPTDPTESGPPACLDGVDNDGDGAIDWPADTGCTNATDSNEINYDACSDGLDNDGDSLFDFPADPGCHSANDDSEVNLLPTTEVRARLLLAFDTSGSMNWNTCTNTFTGGDGSTECNTADVSCATCSATGCGNAVADDSRIYKVKAGLTEAVAAFGEVEYGLMRFHQRPMSFVCPNANASLQSGGWQGSGAAPCPGFSSGDLLVGFSPENQYDLLEWMDGRDNYGGTPPTGLDIELRGTGTTPLAGILSSARTYLQGVRSGDTNSSCRPYRVVLVTDGAESCGGDPVAAAAALNAIGIKVNVIGFATPDTTIQTNLNAIAAAGGTTSAIIVDDSTELSIAMSAIITETLLVELCNELDDDCDTLVDEDFPDKGTTCNNGGVGACFRTGTMVCSADHLSTVCNAPTVTPGTEICNGIDDNCNGLIDDGIPGGCTPCCPTCTEVCNGVNDDCDGQVDESPTPGEGQPCGTDVGQCVAGQLDCVSGQLVCTNDIGPVDEICDNLDNDCDGVIDQFTVQCYTFPTGCTLVSGSYVCQGVCNGGLDTCAAGVQSGCQGQVGPSAELCNGVDDDCDGQIDELWPELNQACDNGLLAECRTTGVFVCRLDGSGTECTAPPVGIGTEICNGIDDDCDTLIDEDPLPPPIGNDCNGGAFCTPGTLDCIDGEVVCVGGGSGSAEICDGFDNDCDGSIDEPTLPDVGGECYTYPSGCTLNATTMTYACEGRCRPGHMICPSGTPPVSPTCDGTDIGPLGAELCNLIDDDCDGLVDNMAECPDPEDLCVEGECLRRCIDAEFQCPFGFTCTTYPEGDFCSPDPCAQVDCGPLGPGFACDPATGDCDDLCDPSPCLAGQVCTRLDTPGFVCEDCSELGCAPGELCVSNGQGVNICISDPCYMVECDDGTFCSDGECLSAVCDPPCGDGQICDPTTQACVAACNLDRCAGIECNQAGQTCDPATRGCVADPCLTVSCTGVQVPTLVCGTELGCSCQDPPPPETELVLATGGGGCACRVDGGHGSPLKGPFGVVLFGLALMGLRRRKRR